MCLQGIKEIGGIGEIKEIREAINLIFFDLRTRINPARPVRRGFLINIYKRYFYRNTHYILIPLYPYTLIPLYLYTPIPLYPFLKNSI